ncbi:GNAT family N-acetyltransferase [Nonomuraea soli]|uniref:RimJ/RimL family protein N-acetyltransferase n=1 Tax=Nonomuraea soli TaxID=1032476 RepID=A0A7W0HRD1_9ACTN|nr:GNAT family N-acetyltransferase [Nonomuraea soli]MBA2892732.1 RimJ/RimL family protein N-acetyltransferase [Nonomuraea soli]
MRHFPLFDLKLTTPRLELRFPSLDDLEQIADVAAEGVHEPGFMPFTFPWSDTTPGKRALSVIQHQFRLWGGVTPEDWSLELAVVHDGRAIGFQGLTASDFAVRKEVLSGSWIGRRFQGQGIGTEMRGAILHLAFAGLKADYATTDVFEDNLASLGVTRKLGYHEDGMRTHNRQGRRVNVRLFRLAVQDWTPRPDIEIHGLEACLPFLGAEEA